MRDYPPGLREFLLSMPDDEYEEFETGIEVITEAIDRAKAGSARDRARAAAGQAASHTGDSAAEPSTSSAAAPAGIGPASNKKGARPGQSMPTAGGSEIDRVVEQIKDDPDWLHQAWTDTSDGDGDRSGIFLSTPHARLMALKYPSVLTISTELKSPTLPWIQIGAKNGFEDRGDRNSSMAGIAFVPDLSREWYTRTLKALVERVLFDPERVKVVVTPFDHGLMEAVAEVFPSAAHHLCETDTLNELRKAGRGPPRLSKDEITEFATAWEDRVIHAQTEESLETGLDSVMDR